MPKGIIYCGDSRTMPEIPDESARLVVTSPPYYKIKDYGTTEQIGFGQSLHEYLIDLYRVWKECHRVLLPGGVLCINIGDQFTRTKQFGRYKVIPLHAEIIVQSEHIGYDYRGGIVWQKKTTMNSSGGGVIMGSYPYPPNGIVEIDYEHILVFKKQGVSRVSKAARERARMTLEEWKRFFIGHWAFKGKRQGNHGAEFPRELPYRLIRMFTVHGDTVIDPFLGNGNTMQAALSIGRNAIGYEINPEYVRGMQESTLKAGGGLMKLYDYEVHNLAARREIAPLSEIKYIPQIQDIAASQPT